VLLQEKGASICTKHDHLLAKTGSETESEYLLIWSSLFEVYLVSLFTKYYLLVKESSGMNDNSPT
jgi:hypothetical protein